jgi:antitoxin component of RelBE/YafQ-DinJ toxin-antitoxin module
MATTQRVQVLLRPTVLEIVKDIGEQEDLTLSKTVSMLVEEALISRGLFDKRYKAGNREAVALQKEEQKLETELEREEGLERDAEGYFFRPEQVSGAPRTVSGKYVTLSAKKTTPLEPDEYDLLVKLKKLKALEEAGLI